MRLMCLEPFFLAIRVLRCCGIGHLLIRSVHATLVASHKISIRKSEKKVTYLGYFDFRTPYICRLLFRGVVTWRPSESFGRHFCSL